MRRTWPKQLLQEVKAHVEFVADCDSGDLSDQETIEAICMRLSAGIEALPGLSDADRAALFGDVWTQMGGCATASHTATSWSSRRSCAALWSETCR